VAEGAPREAEHDYKRALLDKGVTPADIEKTLAAQPSARRGLLEQFGALSGGGKFGVVIVLIVVISVVTGSISSVMHSQTFARTRPSTRPHARRQRFNRRRWRSSTRSAAHAF